MKKLDMYTTQQLAKLANISSRTLRFYEQKGILKPAAKLSSGVRCYSKLELLQLQQILIYRELGLSIRNIQKITKDFSEQDYLNLLLEHRTQIKQKINNQLQLIKTINKTILNIKNRNKMKDEELYIGFSKKEIAAINKEVDEKYDPILVAQSRERVKQMTKTQWTEIGAEAADFSQEIAKLAINYQPEHPLVQAQIKRHYAWINKFYDCTPQIYRGLGILYTTDERFRKHYDKYLFGLADYMQKAMNKFAEGLV